MIKTKTAEEICQTLNKIGRINKGVDDIVTIDEI